MGWERLRIVMGREKRASREGEIRGRRRSRGRGGGEAHEETGKGQLAGLRREKVLADLSGAGRGAVAGASAPQRPLFSLLSGAQVACLAQGNGGAQWGGGSGRTTAAGRKGKGFGDHSRGRRAAFKTQLRLKTISLCWRESAW